MNRLRFLYVLALLYGASACQSEPPLVNSHGSAAALAVAVLDAVANGDRPRLDGLALNEDEFRDHVWPDLPAARPERNLPFSYVWGDLHQKSQIALSSTLKRYTGQRFNLQRVTFADETPYLSFRVHRDATIHARDAAGAEVSLRLCGSMIDKSGAWKVFSYVVD